jgi:ABC-type phosphate/phosphonate transport system substrate-binding protein
MKRVILTVALLSMFIFSGCIVSSSPTSPVISMDKGDTQNFSVVVLPPTDTVKWTLTFFGLPAGTATGHSYTFTPLIAGDYQLTVEDSGSKGYGYNRIWLITVQ